MQFIKERFHVNRVEQRVWSLRQNSERCPLIMLHEGLGCLELWRDFPVLLAQRTKRDVFLFERFGHGQSGVLSGKADGTYLLKEAYDALPEMMKIMGIKRAVFFGHSDGGSIALLFAAAFPKQSAGIISLAAHVFSDPTGLVGIKNAINKFEQGNLREKMLRFHGAGTDGVFWRWARTWTNPDFIQWSIADKLSQITCPVLAMQGEHDEYGEAKQIETIAATVSGPAEGCIIPDCGHAPHLEVPEFVLQKTCELIKKTTATN